MQGKKNCDNRCVQVNLIWQTHEWGASCDGKANIGEDIAQGDTDIWKLSVKEKRNGKRHDYIQGM